MSIIDFLVSSHYKPLINREKENSIKYTYFIDCYDVVDLLKGVKRLTENGESFIKLNDVRTLAYNLILDGWIDNIQMLPTHQSEFMTQLDLNFGIGSPHIKDNDIKYLFENSNFIHDDFRPEKNFSEYISNTVDLSIDRFNIYGLIRNQNWQRRLKLLFDNNRLKISNHNLNELIPLIESNNFKKLKEAVDAIRIDNGTRSNFNDALALTYMLHKKSESEVPILIDTQGFFKKIIKKAKMTSSFTYESEIDGKFQKGSMIRDSSYLVFKSIFDSPPRKIEYIKKKFPKYSKILSYDHSSPRIESPETIMNNIDLERFINGDVDFKKFYDENKLEFKDYLESKFFNKIWLSCFENDSFNEFIQEHFEYQSIDYINHNDAIEAYKKSFQNTFDKIKDSADLLNIITDVFNGITEMKVSEFIKINDNGNLPAFTMYGSFRFSLPIKDNDIEKFENELSRILFENGLLGEKTDIDSATFKITKYLFDAITNENDYSFSLGLACLWSLQRYGLINKVLKNSFDQGSYSHFAFGLVHASSLLKSSGMVRARKEVENIIRCIERKINPKNYKYLLGKSYVYYLMWNSEYQDNYTSTHKEPNQNEYKSFKLSLDSINSCLEYLEFNNKENYKKLLYIYVLNLKIFLVTEGGNNFEFKKLEKWFRIFTGQANANKGFWQGRYDDTVARYYLRSAIIKQKKGNEEFFIANIQNARYWIDKAITNSKQDLETKTNLRHDILSIIEKIKNKDNIKFD